MPKDGDTVSDIATRWAVECDFLISVVSLDGLPKEKKVEVAFAGRSNVGKSSLLNALVGRKKLAKISNTPGRTRMLNFFHLHSADLDCFLVDMPGYGYAKVARGQIIRWTRLVKDYMRGRPNLRRVYLLIDSRRGLMDADKEILKLLQEAAVSTQVILTKADKLRSDKRAPVLEKLTKDLKPFVVVHPEILMTSSVKKTGIDDLRAALIAVCKG